MKKWVYILAVSVACVWPLTLRSSGSEERHMSLSECLNIGLANNLDIKIAKAESKIKNQDALLSNAIFDTTLTGTISYSDDQRAQTTSILGEKTLETDYKLGIQKKLPTGTEVSIDYTDNRTWADSLFAVNNPLHTAQLMFSARQPVLRNFFGYVDRADVKLTKIDVANADLESLSRIEDAVTKIEKAYWELVFTYRNLSLRSDMMKKAEELYETNKRQLKIGLVETPALYGAEGNMRIRQTELVIAENDLKNASNNLKLLLDEGMDFVVVPKEDLALLETRADLADSINEAFMTRRDYRVKRNELDAKKIKLKMSSSNLWPEIDLVGTYALNGVHRKFGKAAGRLTTNKHPMYYGGVEVSMPLENSLARSEYNKAALQKEKVILETRKLEKSIINEIDRLVREVNVSRENAERRINIRQIEQLKLQEEEKSFQRGRSSTKTIIDYQNDFLRAEREEYEALLKYYFALIDLENAKDKLLENVGVLEP